VNPTEEELRVISDLWIETFASDLEKSTDLLRDGICASIRNVLSETEAQPRHRWHPAADCWNAARAMLAAYRAGCARGFRVKPLDPRVFGQRLREARLSKGWTQAVLAEAAGCLNVEISRWETGERTPSLATVCALANVLHVSIDSLATP
jgi:DNA-binding XRE family transcriptional regulator